jgi:hypothetical protein
VLDGLLLGDAGEGVLKLLQARGGPVAPVPLAPVDLLLLDALLDDVACGAEDEDVDVPVDQGGGRLAVEAVDGVVCRVEDT